MALSDTADSESLFEFLGGMKILQNFSTFEDLRFLSTLASDSFIFNSISADELESNILLSRTNLFERRTEFIIREMVPSEYPVESLVSDYESFVTEDQSQPDTSDTGGVSVITAEMEYLTEVLEVIGPDDALRFRFSEIKKNTLIDLYGKPEIRPSLPTFTLPPEDQAALDIEAQSVIRNNIISYDSLSSLGDVAAENLSISSEGGTLTVETTSETEVVEDVGGVTSFARGVDSTETGASRGTRTVDDDTATVARGY